MSDFKILLVIAYAVGIMGGGAAAFVPLAAEPAWESEDEDYATGGMLWDLDGDGYLDLVVGNGNDMDEEEDAVFYNRRGELERAASWRSADLGYDGQLDMGDVDADGDLDVVITGFLTPHLEQLYRNDGGRLTSSPVWTNADADDSFSCALGDVDGDGDIDLSAPGKDQHTVYWFENPGNGRGDWVAHMVGRINEAEDHYADRVAMADINGDGRPDIIVTEEVSPATQGSSVYWFEQPSDPRRVNWVRHRVVTQYTTNAMDVGDVDGDGDIDIVTGEHRGSRRVAVWENRDHGKSWVEHVVDTGKEGYLGARVADLDGDGRLEILSICWDTYPHLHLWRRSVR